MRERVQRERGAAAMGSERWELSGCDPPPCIFVILSLSLNNIVSPVDVGGFAEPRKILCQCACPSLSNYQYITGRNSLTVSE